MMNIKKIIGCLLVDSYYSDDVAVLKLISAEENNKQEYILKIYCHFRITDLVDKKKVVGIMAYAGLHNDESDIFDSNKVDDYLRTLSEKKITITRCVVSKYNDLCITFSNEQQLEVFSATMGIMKTWDIEEGIS